MKIVIIVAAFLLILPVSSQAAWWLTQLHVSVNEKKKLTDNPMQFKLGSMDCGVTETKFIRSYQDRISESRYIYCRTSKDVEVSILVNCNYPIYVLSGININKGSVYYYPAIECGPERADK
jgi:hypothetical protein